MKKLFVSLTLLAFLAVDQAHAAKQVTVAELQTILASARGVGDADFAAQLTGLELTQRLSASRLAQMQSQLPGQKSSDELALLAAQSSFLALPLAEIPVDPAPAVAAQRQIMALVVDYVTKTVHKLPDFMASRGTQTFEDRPARAMASPLPLHSTASTTASVIYRDGHEVDTTARGKKVDLSTGLTSWGEFGPILTTVLMDAAQSELKWSHWEQGESGKLAVFGYAVPKKKSHYQLQFCSGSETGAATSTSVQPCEQFAPYHGEIAADPATGAIRRITVIADLEPGDPLLTASIAVNYGAVDIGGTTYICPVRAEALAQRQEFEAANGAIPSAALRKGSVVTRLNEITFDKYHLYKGESRILTAEEEGQAGLRPETATAGSGAPAELQPALAPVGGAPAPSNTTVTAPAPAAPVTNAAANATESPAPAPAAAPASASVANAAAEKSGTSNPAAASATAERTASADSAGDFAPANSADSPSTPLISAKARQVLLDVIVSKKNGDPVSGLPQQDFAVAEDGKTQTIDFFEEHASGAATAAAPPAMPQLPPDAATNAPAAPLSSALYVLLLDSLNSEPQDQVYIQQQVLSYLKKMQPGTQVAAFALGTKLRLLQGFTADPAALLAALSKESAERDATAQTRSDNADDATHVANLQAMRASASKIQATQASEAAAHGYAFGARASMTFEALNALARYLEGIPGRKNLIWFASSFPVAFFPSASQMEALKNNPNLPGYVNSVKQTANLFTVSKIAVYPVSGAGVMTADVGTADSAGSGRVGGANSTAPMAGAAMGAAAATQSMEQLAASTGGRAFTTNDIDGALRRIVRDSEDYYTLGYAPHGSATGGGFRRIDVKVAPGKYNLAYRQGYNADGSGGPGDSAQAQNPLTPLLGLGLPSATGILYGVRATLDAEHGSEPAGQNPNLTGNLTRYAVEFTIRPQDVEFDEAPNGRRIAKLVVGVKAYGNDGSALNWQATRESIELTPQQYESIGKSGIPVRLALDLPVAATSAHLITAIYDWNSGRAGTLEIAIGTKGLRD